jgi:signal transduction histidine kinase
VSKGKLTRQELGWLLTQEAQGAAERLRKGVSALTQPPPSGVELKELAMLTRDPEAAIGDRLTSIPRDSDPGSLIVDPEATRVMDASLSALDDAMRMLSSLHTKPAGRGRRGRIDLASLLWEVAPEARVSIEPGSGTEVFGDESEIRRMLYVLLGHGSNTGSGVSVRREGDEVVVAVAMGPDSSPTAETERAWLSRMALRYGGRYELESGGEVLALPAEGVEARDDVAKLRKELDEAKKQGEAYARELAAVWASSDDPVSSSSFPPPQTPGIHRFAAMSRLAGGVAATLRAILSPVARDLADLKPPSSPRRSSPEIDVHAPAPPRSELEEKLEVIRRKFLVVQDFVAELAMVGEGESEEPMRAVDLGEVVRGQARSLEARAARAGVEIHIQPDDPAVRVIAHAGPKAVAVLARELLSHAIAASTRGTSVAVTLQAATQGLGAIGARIVIDDTGTSLPGSARRPLMALEVEPGTFGRPSGVSLFVAAEIAMAQGALLEVGDTATGGVRVTVTFPR